MADTEINVAGMEEAEAGTEVDGVYLELCTWRKLNKLRGD